MDIIDNVRDNAKRVRSNAKPAPISRPPSSHRNDAFGSISAKVMKTQTRKINTMSGSMNKHDRPKWNERFYVETSQSFSNLPTSNIKEATSQYTPMRSSHQKPKNKSQKKPRKRWNEPSRYSGQQQKQQHKLLDQSIKTNVIKVAKTTNISNQQPNCPKPKLNCSVPTTSISNSTNNTSDFSSNINRIQKKKEFASMFAKLFRSILLEKQKDQHSDQSLQNKSKCQTQNETETETEIEIDTIDTKTISTKDHTVTAEEKDEQSDRIEQNSNVNEIEDSYSDTFDNDSNDDDNENNVLIDMSASEAEAIMQRNYHKFLSSQDTQQFLSPLDETAALVLNELVDDANHELDEFCLQIANALIESETTIAE